MPISLSAGLVALVVLSSGLASATVIKPPLHGAKVIALNPKSVAGTGKTTLTAKASFNTSTGKGLFSDNATATWSSLHTNNSASQEGFLEITVPISAPTTGSHNIDIIWFTIARGSVNLSAGKCTANSSAASSSCTRGAAVFVDGFAILQDLTSHTNTTNTGLWAGNMTSLSNVTTCVRSHCTSNSTGSATTSALHTGKAFWSWSWTSVSFTSTHKYDIQMIIFGGAVVLLETTGGAKLSSGVHGNAQFNSATLGSVEQLVSITVS